jgi:amphi-Trp domain-containing protein
MGDEKFVFESLQDPKTIRVYLQSLIDGLDKGRVLLTTQDQEIVLQPQPAQATVKAKKKSDGSKISLSINWKYGNARVRG